MADIFDGLVFTFAGTKFSKPLSKADLKQMIEDNGGFVVESFSKKVTHVVAAPSEAEKNGSKVTKAKENNIPVVTENFIVECDKEKKLLDVANYTLGATTSSATASSSASTSDKKRNKDEEDEEEEEKEKEPEKKIQKVVAKGGAAVDHRSGLAGSGTIYTDSTAVWNAMLNQTNIAQNNNKFYLIQLIQHPGGFTTFTCWGRVGENGQNDSFDYKNVDSAKSMFMKKFKDKTGNDWNNRANFVPKNNKYTLLDINYNDESDDEEEDAQGQFAAAEEKKKREEQKAKLKSKLDTRVQELVKLISNVQTMTQTMKEFDIDLKKMPLGKLSKQQIKAGYQFLKDLSEAIDGKSRSEIADLSSQFYTNIPHDFGRRVPPLIDTKEKVKAKMEMLETLAELEVASKLLDTADKEMEHPLDAAYNSLKTDLVPLDHNDPEFLLCKEYVQTTHAPTHSQYTLEVLDVFKVNRHGEADRFEPNKHIGNRRLLWHGSRTTNFMGILSTGLRIAPPEAPATGYMFGKGIYFADLVSKSANYCFTSPNNDIGCMLLSDVALGNMHELTHASYVTQLPTGKHSTFGQGKTTPDPLGYRPLLTDPNVTVPLGKPVSSNIHNSSLLYNEFIVYDVAQVNLKYMLKIKFNYKTLGSW